MESQQLKGAILADRFKLQELIGEGGYGAVYRAVQLSVDRPCAVKVLAPELCSDQRTEQRFRIEARMTSRLTHPNTVVLYDFGHDQERSLLFLAMELLEGRSVKEVVETDGPMSVCEAAGIVEQVAGSLREAHQCEMIHRDVKPHNLMVVGRGGRAQFVKVIDFGIAKVLRADATLKESLTKTGMMIGSPAYMAPEQIRAREMDGRSDEYALAMTTYYMLSGQTPFGGGTSMQVASRHLTEQAPPLRQLHPGLEVDPKVEEVLQKAAAKQKEDRFDDVEAFAEAFADAASRNKEDRRAVESSVEETSEVDAPEEAESSSTLAVPQADWIGVQPTEGTERETAELPEPSEAEEGRREPDGSERWRSWIGMVGLSAGLLATAAGIWLLAGASGGTETVEKEAPVADAPESDQIAAAVSAGRAKRSRSVDHAVSASADAAASLEVGGKPVEQTASQAEDKQARSESSDVEKPALRAAEETKEKESPPKAPEPKPDPPSPGRLQVRMIPWGTLVVDGAEIGNGTSVETRLQPGRHHLEMKQQGKVVDETTVRIETGGEKTVELVAQ